MLRAKTESITWGLDEGGYFLKIRTSLARQITEAIKAGVVYVVEIKRHRKRRSLDQNDMYWGLLSKVAEAAKISKPRAHNLMLRRYGQLMTFDGEVARLVLPDTDETEDKIAEMEHNHYKPTSEVRPGKNGKMYRTYLLLKGSHEMDTAEMTRLIDGVMDEAKQMGLTLIWEG